MKDIIVLGSTGSVGRSVLDVVRHFPGEFRIKAISAAANVPLLIEQAEEFGPETVTIRDAKGYADLKKGVREGPRVLCGEESLEQLAGEEAADIIFMAISGTAALRPLVAALSAGRTVALSSKEPVVSAGKLLNDLAAEKGGELLPVDSEHSAVMQCLAGRGADDVRTLYITGSGGPLRDRKAEEFDALSIEEILDHPKWDMGRKITVDSATLMNKGLEVIEARWLFDVPADRIKVVIHPEAVIHAMVEFVDGTVSAGLFCPDMRFPILRALSYPDILESDFPRLDFSDLKKLTFSSPDTGKFPALDLAFRVLREEGTAPAVLNAANETAVNLFLENKLRFTDIVKTIEMVLGRHSSRTEPSLEEIMNAERWAAEEVLRSC